MEAKEANSDDATLRIDDDATDIAEIEANRIHDAVDFNVTVNAPGYNDQCTITVYWKNSENNTNSYTKARMITEVLNSPASVTLHCTDDGRKAATFVAQ